jgi:CelD/BcsL family acetyltransferase involved in cellulose biosynthesis
MPLRAEIISDGEALAALAPQWWALWRRCPSATPFQTPGWLLPWWRHFLPGRLATIAVWRDGQLAGLAPFYIEDGQEAKRLLPVGIALSDYLDVLIEPGWEQEAAALIFEAGLALDWDRWEFEELRPEAIATALACPEILANSADEQSACPVIALEGGDDLAGCVPARRRRQLRRAHAAAARRGTVSIEASSETGMFLDGLFRLHCARWAERGEEGIVGGESVQGFHREALAALSSAGLARCYQIRIGERIAGAYYGMCDGKRAYAYLGGFGPAFSAESPGSILTGHAIAEAIREGAEEFHFLRGREAYKYSWGATDRWNRRRFFRRVSPR